MDECLFEHRYKVMDESENKENLGREHHYIQDFIQPAKYKIQHEQG